MVASVKIPRRKKMRERKLWYKEVWHEIGDGSWRTTMYDIGNIKGIHMDFCEQRKLNRVGSV